MKPLLALMFVGLGCAWAQDKAGLHARELFYAPVPQVTQPQATPAAPAAPSGNKSATKRTPTPAPQAAPQTTGKAGSPPDRVPDRAPDPVKAPVPTITVAVTPSNLGLRYSVLKRDAGGQFQEVDPDTNFRSGDRIRVQVSSNTAGYLYVVAQGSSGTWQLLFPSAEVAGGSNLIHGGEARMVPAGDRGQWVFNEQAGVEKLFVVLTRQPESDLEKLIYAIGSPQGGATQSAPQTDTGAARTLLAKATVSDDIVERLRRQVSSRDLVFEKVDGDAGGKIENAAYVVNTSAAPDARLVVDVSLKHK